MTDPNSAPNQGDNPVDTETPETPVTPEETQEAPQVVARKPDGYFTQFGSLRKDF